MVGWQRCKSLGPSLEQHQRAEEGQAGGSSAQPPMLPDPEWAPAWCYKDARFGPPSYRGRPLPPSPPEAQTRPHSYGEGVAMGFIPCLAPAAVPTCRAAWRLLPDSPTYIVCRPYYPFSHFLTLHFTTLVPSDVHLSLLPKSTPHLKLLLPHQHQIWYFWYRYLGNLHLMWYTWYSYLGMVAVQDCTSQKVLSAPPSYLWSLAVSHTTRP